MSHAGLILGLPELEVERVDRNDAIRICSQPQYTFSHLVSKDRKY